jgi:hypothetical protein
VYSCKVKMTGVCHRQTDRQTDSFLEHMNSRIDVATSYILVFYATCIPGESVSHF